jgi:hypothetical protein
MHRNPVRSRIRKITNELVGILYHQMAVKGQLGCPAKRFHHGWPNCEVGDKMPVHDIDMDDTGAARRGLLYLIRQVGEVRREYGGCEFNQNRIQGV